MQEEETLDQIDDNLIYNDQEKELINNESN